MLVAMGPLARSACAAITKRRDRVSIKEREREGELAFEKEEEEQNESVCWLKTSMGSTEKGRRRRGRWSTSLTLDVWLLFWS
jgi:hypothetical protein